MTIELPDDLAGPLQEMADALGTSPSGVVEAVLRGEVFDPLGVEASRLNTESSELLSQILASWRREIDPGFSERAVA